MTENKKLNEFKRPPIKIVMQSSLKVKRKEDAPIVCATYARVSSNEQKQKGDLDRQSQRVVGVENVVLKKYISRIKES